MTVKEFIGFCVAKDIYTVVVDREIYKYLYEGYPYQVKIPDNIKEKKVKSFEPISSFVGEANLLIYV